MDAHESVLIVLVKSEADWEIVCNRHWYRMPLRNGPAMIAAKWIAFYQTGRFGQDRWSIRCYARILDVQVVRRVDLFPDQPDHPRAQDPYYAISFDPPARLVRPLTSDRPRRLVWSLTTWWRFTSARTLADLFTDEPLPPPPKDQVLVGIVPRTEDLEIARTRHWYRVPHNMVRDWASPSHVAFYLGSAFGSESGLIRQYAEVWHADIVRRLDLFPDQPRHPRAHQDYIRLHLGELQTRPAPIPSRRRRRIVLLPTTWERFVLASDLNDLVEGDPDEEAFYARMTGEGLRPERAYDVRGANAYYLTDYALFCRRRNVQVDIDGAAVRRNAFLAARPHGNAEPADNWSAMRLSRFDITRRTEECVKSIRGLVDGSGGMVTA